jgi:ubiquinone/menaquinone biosynthesis C-methylase UbiE
MGYDLIARHYDRMASLVFGNSLARAQTYFLDGIPPSSKVLVLGGGTGWWLNDFFRVNPTCKVLYVEESSEMIRLAKRFTGDDYRITFRVGTQDSISERNEFDVVILFCYLDLFSVEKLKEVIVKIDGSLKSNALWVVNDFVETKWWHSILLFVMYRFFKVTTGIKNQHLPPWHNVLIQSGLTEVKSKLYSRGFIKSALYFKVIV